MPTGQDQRTMTPLTIALPGALSPENPPSWDGIAIRANRQRPAPPPHHAGAGAGGTGKSGAMWGEPDVRTLLAQPALGEVRLVAGAAGAGHAVHGSVVARSQEDLERPATGQLVVTTLAALAGAGAGWDGPVARLDAAGAAAVLVRLGPGEPLPEQLLGAAERHELPLLLAPAGASSSEVNAAVLDVLLEAQRAEVKGALDVRQRFADVLLGGGGTAEVLGVLHALVHRPVAFIDIEGRPTVAVPAIATDAGAVATEDGLRWPVGPAEEPEGEVVAWAGAAGTVGSPEAPQHEREVPRSVVLLALEQAATAIGVRRAQARAVAAAQERFAALSLEELVSGHAAQRAEVVERASSFGWDLHRPRAVLLASVDPRPEGDTPQGAVAVVAAAARATLGRDAIVWTRGQTVAALVAPLTDEPAERRRIALGLQHELDERLRRATVSIGVGRRADGPTGLPSSFAEASRAVDVGRWAKGRHVTEVFDELGLERLLAACPTSELAAFVQAAIGALVDHDRQRDGALVETLAAWLQARNMAEAARRVHVHYNTLKNRLERIEAIVGPVLSDPAKALECEVAIHVAGNYDGPWRSDGGEGTAP
ncbi:MAG: hypothetical protein GEV08_22880 [Acidimicrobiia bacterium]|nr:hypothetical protein [Acidimicrobiia bacterium]